MRRSYVVLSVEILIFVVLIFAFVLASMDYHVSITYMYDDASEWHAIEVFEATNYSKIIDQPPFVVFSEQSDHPYYFARYVNGYVIDHYLKLMDGYRKRLKIGSAALIYSATAELCDTITITISVLDVLDTVQIDVLEMNISVDVLISENYTTGFAMINESGKFVDINWSMTLELQDVFLVYGHLRYDETWGPLTGYLTIVEQLVILDADYSIILAISGAYGGIVR